MLVNGRTRHTYRQPPWLIRWRSARPIAVALSVAGALWVACVCSLLASAPALALPPPVSVTLEPRQISLGDTAQLTITSTGSGMDGITLPVVAGLEFRVVGQSRRVEIINGATLSTTSVVLRITPQTAGIFTIPGLTPQSQPLLLRVSPDSSSGNPSQYNNNPQAPSRPPVAAGGSSPSGIRMTADGAAFVRMNLPKRDVYVGESIPVDIEVGMRAGFVTSVNGLPTLTGNDFTLNSLSHKPERVEKMIDGKPFTVLTWHSVLAPVKPGVFTLSVETPLTIRVRTRPARDSMIDDLLGDPFLQNFFGATVPKDITAASTPAELKVLALPTDGQPADFSGAVGSFKIASDMSSPTAAVGDPLTLRLHVTGTGNFDRVDTPMLEHVENWKTYPPKSSFNQADAVGTKGEKTFEQPLIAAHPGAQTLPDLTFSYFDPTSRHYETAHSTPPAVTIAPALAETTPPPADSTAAGTPARARAAQPAADGLQPDRVVAGDQALGSLEPLYLRSGFLVLPSIFALACAGGWLGLRRRGLSGDGNGAGAGAGVVRGRRTKQQLSKTHSRQLAQMEGAARAGDAATFFTVARTALQQNSAARADVAHAALTPQDADVPPGSDGDDLHQLFALADEANYAGHRMTSTDFERWIDIVRQRLLDQPARSSKV